ncbi:MAG: STAS domain-containing protein [Planctomycetota bacterium]|jgi:anti-sigma B factor antagonist
MIELEGEFAFRLELEEVDEAKVLVITLKDSTLNYSSTDSLKPALKDIIQSGLDGGKRNFVVNLQNVGIVDSCGLSVLISLKKQVEAGGAHISLAGLNGMIQRLFTVTRLDKAFPTFEDSSAAVAAVQAG